MLQALQLNTYKNIRSRAAKRLLHRSGNTPTPRVRAEDESTCVPNMLTKAIMTVTFIALCLSRRIYNPLPPEINLLFDTDWLAYEP